jgi:hypothetical protein
MGQGGAMPCFFRILVAFSLLWPAQALSDRLLKELRVGDELRSDESIAVGPRAIRLPQSSWHLLALRRDENREIGATGAADVTSGVFAYIDGTRALAVVYFGASETSLVVSRWQAYEDCGNTPSRFLDRFGSSPNQPECHEVRLVRNFLGSGLRGIWVDAKQRLTEIGVGWSGKQLYSRYSRLPWGETFHLSIYISPRLFAPKGSAIALETNDDIPQAFVDWSKKQIVQLRRLAERKIDTFAFDDLPKPEGTAVADLPSTQARPG